MRMERINDREVRCVITNRDLQKRKISVSELKYGSKATSELFREMITTASDQYGFNEEELPVMIEAVPVSPEELLVILQAVEDAEELDPHYAKFADTPAIREEQPLEKFFDPEAMAEALKICLIYFADLDGVMEVCRHIGGGFSGKSYLYRAGDPGGFYLAVLRPEGMSGKDFNVFLNSILEFGNPVQASSLLYASLKEHETPVMEDPILKLQGI